MGTWDHPRNGGYIGVVGYSEIVLHPLLDTCMGSFRESCGVTLWDSTTPPHGIIPGIMGLHCGIVLHSITPSTVYLRSSREWWGYIGVVGHSDIGVHGIFLRIILGITWCVWHYVFYNSCGIVH